MKSILTRTVLTGPFETSRPSSAAASATSPNASDNSRGVSPHDQANGKTTTPPATPIDLRHQEHR